MTTICRRSLSVFSNHADYASESVHKSDCIKFKYAAYTWRKVAVLSWWRRLEYVCLYQIHVPYKAKTCLLGSGELLLQLVVIGVDEVQSSSQSSSWNSIVVLGTFPMRPNSKKTDFFVEAHYWLLHGSDVDITFD